MAQPNGHHGDARTINLEQLSDADRQLAADFGYKPVFKRRFGYLSAFSFAVSISGLFATVAATFAYPLDAGGSASAVWCWLISGAGCMCIATSVAELVSAYPTCGGLYYTVSKLAPRAWVPSLSWITGWLNLLGQVAGIASSEWGSAAFLLAAVSMGTDFAYLPSPRENVAVMAGLTIVTGVVNSSSTYWLEKMTKTYVVFHVLALFSCCVCLLLFSTPTIDTPGPDRIKHTSEYVFTDVNNTSGWKPNGWSFMFGFLSASWVMTDYDAVAHITEEIEQPELVAPWALSLAMGFTYFAGFLYTITLCFVMGDPVAVLDSKMQQPVAQIFYDVLGKSGGIFFTICAFIILKFVTFVAMQALARTLFAFSRDNMVPASHLWTRILPLTGTPVLAVWICVVFCISINLVGLGSYIAIAGVFNVCAIALDWSYCIPIACKLLFGRFEPGPWNLGRFSTTVNVIACVWTFFVSIIFILPTKRPVEPSNMNYAVAYLGLIFVFAVAYWYLAGRNFYTGPRIEANIRGGVLEENGPTMSGAIGTQELVELGDLDEVQPRRKNRLSARD